MVRKGHPGFSFYFVFSGAVCATLDEDEETAFTNKETTVLKKGTSFGVMNRYPSNVCMIYVNLRPISLPKI